MLLYGQDALVAEWVRRQLKMRPFPEGLYCAVGILVNNEIKGGIVWNNYHTDNYGKPLLIEMTIAIIDKKCCTRQNLRELFSYPFRQLRVKRVQATCGRKAKRVRSSLLRLGFKFEGIIREGSPRGGDAAHYSMLQHECVWVNDKNQKN